MPGDAAAARGAEAALAAAVLFLAIVQVLCLWSGALGLRLGQPLAVGFAGAAAAGAAFGAWRLLAATGPDRRPAGDTARRPRFADTLGWALAAGALLGSLVAWSRLARLDWLRPPYDWDGLSYHIPAMSGWAAAGRVCWLGNLPDMPFANGYPMAVETTGLLTARLLGTSRLVDGGNLLFWPLAVLGLRVIAGWLGLSRGWAWLPAGLIAGVPAFVSQSATCYVDPAYATTVIAAIAAVGLLVLHDGRGLAWKCVVAGAACGLAAGTKGTGAVHAALLILAVPLAGRLVRRADGTAAWRRRAGIVAAVAFVVAGYWYLRNVIHTGNPVFPIEIKFGGQTLAAGYSMHTLLSGNLPAWLARWPAPLRPPVAWLQTDAPIVGYDLAGGLGFLWPAGLLAALFVVARALRRERPDPLRRPILLLAAVVLALLFLQPGAWWARLTLWLHALGLPCLALALWRGARAARRTLPRLAICVAGVGVLALGAWEGRTALVYAERENLDLRPEREGPYLPTDVADFRGLRDVPGWDEFMTAPCVGRSRWGRIGTLFGGVLAMPLGRREVVFVGEDITADGVAGLRRDGVRWVAWEVTGAGPVPEPLAAAAASIVPFKPGDDFDLRLIRLAPAAP